MLYLATVIPSIIPWINTLASKIVSGGSNGRIDSSYRIFEMECLFRQYVSEWAIEW